MTTTFTTEARHETLPGLLEILKAQQDPRLDAVIPATAITARGGKLHVPGLTLFGDATLTPSEDCNAQIAGKLGIPVQYIRTLAAKRPDLYDANVNGWLHGYNEHHGTYDHPGAPSAKADSRKFLLRSFITPGISTGTARALFSDKYGIVDNLDALMAVVDGINLSGETAEVVECNLSERQMSVSFAAPSVAALAPTLLGHYRPPTADGISEWVPGTSEAVNRLRDAYRGGHLGYEPGSEPIVFAGFRVRNSETGWTKFHIDPMLRVKMCTNGLVMNVLGESFSRVHLGGRMAEGTIDWSQDTMRKQLAVITAQARDAVQAFLNPEFLDKAVARVERAAGTEIAEPAKAIELVTKTFGFTEEEQESILRHFTIGGQSTAGGVLNAITSVAQTVKSTDRSEHLSDKAVAAMELVAAG